VFSKVDLRQMYELVNHERTARGLPALRRDMQLDAAAMTQVLYLIHHNRSDLQHEGPSGEGPAGRLTKLGAAFGICGENIGQAYDAVEAVKSLMKSPGHRSNILEASFQRISLAARLDKNAGYNRVLYCQVFAD
jgi:uncharacterized protein YkwD